MKEERERDMFPSARQMFFVIQPSDVDFWRIPIPVHTHTHAHTYTHIHARVHSHVNICGDSSHWRSSRSEPHLLLDLPHTHTTLSHTHTRMHKYSYFTLGPNQTWPSLSSPHTHTTNTHIINIQRYTHKHTSAQAHHKRTTSTTAAVANQSWLVGPLPTLCQLLKRKNTQQH